MSLINCPECGKEISSEAETCPHCGIKQIKQPKSSVNKKASDKQSIIVICIVAVVVIFFYFICNRSQPTLTPEQKKQQEKIEAQNKRLIAKFGPVPHASSMDGSVYMVKRYLEASAKDPDSLVFEQWSEVGYNENQGWTVKVIYRGKNSFGGYVRECKWFVIRFENIIAVNNCN